MKSLTNTLLALLLSANVFAVEIPNQFEDGQVTSASQMNENFQALKAELEVLEARITSLEGVSMSNNTKPILVGFSENSFAGTAGLGPMNKACSNQYSGSFFCSTKDIIESSTNELLLDTLSDFAWIRPYNMASQSYHTVDISGILSGDDTLSCMGWLTGPYEGDRGMALTKEGNLRSQLCMLSAPVACCK